MARREKKRYDDDACEGVFTLEIYPKGDQPNYPNHCPQVAFVVDNTNSFYLFESTMMPTGGGR